MAGELDPKHRQAISDGLKGHICSAETRAKISAAKKGKPISEATRKASIAYHTGRKLSEEHKAKIRASCAGLVNSGQFPKGHIPWSIGGGFSTARKGTQLPEWWKAKLSAAKKGKAIPHLHNEKVWKKISDAQRGQDRGGNMQLIDKVRNLNEYKAWRKTVYEKDSYTCVMCGDSHGGNLQADHIEALSYLLKKHSVNDVQTALICAELWDIANGRTVCINCHRKTDTYGGRQTAANRKQIYG